jgi:protein CpxP
MDKIKLLTIAVITLLVLNLGTLGFLLFSAPNKQHPLHAGGFEGRPKPREIIIKKLDFDTNQIKQYDERIAWHRQNIRAVEDDIRNSKNELYLLLNSSPVNEKAKDSLILALSNDQKRIESIHFQHFQDIKKICTPKQLDLYKELSEELSKLFSKPPRPERD